MTSEEILLDAEERMEKAIAKLKNDLTGIRTGRANPGLRRFAARRGLRLADADQDRSPRSAPPSRSSS